MEDKEFIGLSAYYGPDFICKLFSDEEYKSILDMGWLRADLVSGFPEEVSSLFLTTSNAVDRIELILNEPLCGQKCRTVKADGGWSVIGLF